MVGTIGAREGNMKVKAGGIEGAIIEHRTLEIPPI